MGEKQEEPIDVAWIDEEGRWSQWHFEEWLDE